MTDYQVRHKRILALLKRLRALREKAEVYQTTQEKLKAMALFISLTKRVTGLMSESIEQQTKFIEDSKFYRNQNLERFYLNLPASINDRKIWTCVADDHRLILDKTVEILKPQFEVVGTAADGIAALEMIRLIEPEIAVLDISMPYKTGIEIAADLKGTGSASKVVLLTAHDDYDYKEAALSAGALGFVKKGRMVSDLIPALQSAHAGMIFISA